MLEPAGRRDRHEEGWLPLVLVVEDDPTDAHLIVGALRRLDVFYGIVATAREAVEYLHARPVDCLIVDVNLPDGRGLEVARAAQEEPRSRLPTLVCTGLSDRRTVGEALVGGVAGFVVKPVQAQDIERRARDLVGSVPSPWAPLSRTLGRLGVSLDELPDILRESADMIEGIAQGLGGRPAGEVPRSVALQLKTVAGTIGHVALSEMTEALLSPEETEGAMEAPQLAAHLRRERTRVDLLIRALAGGSRQVDLPHRDEARHAGRAQV